MVMSPYKSGEDIKGRLCVQRREGLVEFSSWRKFYLLEGFPFRYRGQSLEGSWRVGRARRLGEKCRGLGENRGRG